MKNLKIRSKLILNAVIPILLLVTISSIGLLVSNQVNAGFAYISDIDLPLVENLSEMKFASSRLISSVNEYILNETLGLEQDAQEIELADIAEATSSLQANFAAFAQIVGESYIQESPMAQAIQAQVNQIIAQSNEIIEMLDTDAPIEEIAEAREAFETLEIDILAIIDEELEEERQEVRETDEAIENSLNLYRVTVITIGGAAAFIAIALYLYIYRSIVFPLSDLRNTAEKLKQGDLTQRAQVRTPDEIGEVAFTFNVMANAIQQRQTALNDLNQSLEQRITERTAELRASRDEAVRLQTLAQDNARLKSEFLSTMSHELRTPLNAIEGFTSIMLAGMGIELSPRAEDMVKRVSMNSKRLLALVNDFLDLSRIEAGRLELVYQPISPTALAHKWQNQMSVLADKKNIAFEVIIDPDLPPTIMGDEDALSKIVINLLGNAFKFTHNGKVTMALEKDTTRWMLSVTDTGIGIPTHARDYIFDEFRQVDSSSKRIYGGTGLGLALVKKLAREMGGTVALESEVGRGSKFTVFLPLEILNKEPEVLKQ